MKRLLLYIAAGIVLAAFAPYAIASTPQFQVNTLSGGSLTTGEVSYYNMQGNSNDYWGSNNGTDTSMSYSTSTGKVSEGASFNGSTSKIAQSGSLGISGSGAMSVAMWINPSSVTGLHTMFTAGNPGGAAGSSFLFGIGELGSGSLGVDLSGVSYVHTATGVIGTGSWHFVVFTYAAGTNMNTGINIWLDGVQQTLSGGAASVPNITASYAAVLGEYGTTGGDYFTGDMDEVVLYSKVLSANEISDLYNGGAGQTMCNGTGGPVCASGGSRHKIIIVSFVAKPEHPLA